MQLLATGLKYYPQNVPWLRLMGDLNFGKFLSISFAFFFETKYMLSIQF